MPKLPSIQTLLDKLGIAARRFPLAILSALTATFILIYCTHEQWSFESRLHFTWAKLLMCSELGLCLFIASALISEARGYGISQKIFINVFFFALICIYYFSIGHYESFNLDSFTRYTLYVIGAHLLVSFAPFTRKGDINGFWQFNKSLFLRFLLSMLYTLVLYGGISFAFWLIDELLHIEVKYTKYLYAWYFMACTFNTLVFLSGVPNNIKELDSNTSYPKGLKTFTQFVFLPLVTLYFLILYAYLFQIIFDWKLPKGMISYLVISISIAGILSLLLIYPIRNNEENKWIKIFSKWFYVALYPLIVLLALAIHKRIHDYGITEHRYFILILAGWLVCIAAYFLISKKENIKLIPVSLFALTLLTSLGPWGAFSISKQSQKNRLEKLLIKNGILVNGKIKKLNNPHSIHDSDGVDIQSIINYFNELNNLSVIQPWFNITLDSIKPPKNQYYVNKPDSIMSLMGLNGYSSVYYTSYSNNKKQQRELTFFRKESPSAIDVNGWDYYADIEYDYYGYDNSKIDTTERRQYFGVDSNSTLLFSPSSTWNKFWISENGKIIYGMDMNKYLDTLKSKYDKDTIDSYNSANVPGSELHYDIETENRTIRFVFRNISIYINKNRVTLNSFSGYVLTKYK